MRQLKIRKMITPRGESISLQAFLDEIAKIDMITPTQEESLAIKIGQGDQVALNKLVKANLRFVVSVAKQYQHQGLSLSDLINEGNVGLIKAAQRFDLTRGFKFISYAVWWIRQSILLALAEHSRLVRLPQNKIITGNKIDKAYSNFEQEFGREPSAEELSSILKIDIGAIESTIYINNCHTSIDAPFSEEGSDTLLDVLNDQDFISTDYEVDHKESLSKEIQYALNILPEREKYVLKHFYGIGVEHPMDLKDIGEKYTLTKERARQLKDKAVKAIRNSHKAKTLKAYLG